MQRLVACTNLLNPSIQAVRNLRHFNGFITSRSFSLTSSDNLARESVFTDEHVELRRSLNKIIEKEINPYVDEWEAACRFPAHDVFKKLGNAGFLGVTKPVEYGGMGLDFTFGVAVAEELGIFRKINGLKLVTVLS